LLRRRTRRFNEVMNIIARVRGFSLSDLMISTAAIAVGYAVIRALSGLHLGVFILAIPLGGGRAERARISNAVPPGFPRFFPCDDEQYVLRCRT
jgi:hypothetical protein